LNVKIVNTDDGSNTILNQEIDETYHSTFGAISESDHVFIKNGLEKVDISSINVLEIGFGTGLNAFLSAIYAQSKETIINYCSLEKYPLESSIINKLNYSSNLGFPEIFNKLHQAEWDNVVQICPFFKLCKLNQDLIHFNFDQIEKPDLIFFDAFSPKKQPEMWHVDIFKKIHDIMNLNGILVTYTASGIVKNALRDAGFNVKRLKGPPGKHHMVLARKIEKNTA
jgi:tRNA U34 5-methylaminomethyl-2-thiouridine-forming methyltransferase MnmC